MRDHKLNTNVNKLLIICTIKIAQILMVLQLKTILAFVKTQIDSFLNTSYTNGKLSHLQRQFSLSLIPKQGNDLETLTSWRPVSLLNFDYKNCCNKSSANKMEKIILLHQSISYNEMGFIKGRYIVENSLIHEVINYFND